jgi:signal recognition particle subunit SRP54
MRLLYEQFQNITKMGPMSQVMSMIPGMADALPQGSERAGQAKIKRMLCLMDSMSDTELDTCNMKILTDKKRMIRIARGAGKSPQAYIELLEEFKRLAKMMKGMKGMKMPKEGSRGRGGHGQQQAMQQQMSQMMSALPPQMRNMFGGEKGLMNMMQQMEKDPSMMNKMMGMMGNKR